MSCCVRNRSYVRPDCWIREVEVRPVEGQIDDLIGEVNKEIEKKNKVLITTLTKKMAEDLTEYMTGDRHPGEISALRYRYS